jgi:hypothetical protein
MNRKHEQRIEAHALRGQGKSLNQIADTLGVSKSSVSVWVSDVDLSDEQKACLKDRQRTGNEGAQANRDRHLQQRRAFQAAGRAQAREGRPLHMQGCMLYWAEGAKQRNRLYFVNSDPNMMLLFIRFLRDELDVNDADVTLHIHCHDVGEVERIEQFWLSLLQLPALYLKKTQVKSGSSTRRNILVNGVCAISVYSTELVQHVYGAIQEYGGFDNPEWLF